MPEARSLPKRKHPRARNDLGVEEKMRLTHSLLVAHRQLGNEAGMAKLRFCAASHLHRLGVDSPWNHLVQRRDLRLLDNCNQRFCPWCGAAQDKTEMKRILAAMDARGVLRAKRRLSFELPLPVDALSPSSFDARRDRCVRARQTLCESSGFTGMFAGGLLGLRLYAQPNGLDESRAGSLRPLLVGLRGVADMRESVDRNEVEGELGSLWLWVRVDFGATKPAPVTVEHFSPNTSLPAVVRRTVQSPHREVYLAKSQDMREAIVALRSRKKSWRFGSWR